MGIYQSCYQLIQQYIYGGAELTADMSLTATLISTTASIALFAIPFVLVFWVCKLIVGGWKV